jgi:tetratricopeptide (TPR) repeat protein
MRGTADGVRLDLMLARAYWLRDQPQQCLELVDRVLGLAESMDLVEVVAEAMILRGGALGDIGRTYEGLPSMEAGIALAERHGASLVALRGRNSLSGYTNSRDPRRALELLTEGIAEARRLGQRATVLRMLTNAAGVWVETGTPETAIREMSEILAGQLAAEDRLFAQANLLNALVVTGGDYESLYSEFETSMASEQDPNVLNNIHAIRAQIGLVKGRFAEAHAAALEAARLSPFNAPTAISLAAHAAAWARDPVLLAQAHEAHIATRAHGGAIDLRRAAMSAGMAALDGRIDEAMSGLRAAMAGLRSLGSLAEEAMTGIDAAALAGNQLEPELLAAIRARLDEVGYRAFVPVLDGLLGDGAPAVRSVQAAADARAGQAV